MTDRPVLYWDSVVFISYLTGADPDRLSLVKALLVHLQNDKFDLVTSTFTLSEVRYYRTGPFKGSQNDKDREDEIAALFTSPLIEFRAVTDFIGRRAWQIGCQFPDISPADAVHIATAEDVPAETLFTWDGSGVPGRRWPEKMLAYDGKIGTPPISIKIPSDPWRGLLLIEDAGRPTPLLGAPTAPQQPAEQSPSESPG